MLAQRHEACAWSAVPHPHTLWSSQSCSFAARISFARSTMLAMLARGTTSFCTPTRGANRDVPDAHAG